MEVIEMRKSSSFAALIFIVILGIGVGLAYAMYSASRLTVQSVWIGVIAFVIALVVSLAIKVADQWDKAVILRLGNFRSLKGPGLFFIIPVIDSIAYWIDTRVITSFFQGRKDPYQRYGARGCGCRAVLESFGPQEGSPGCSRLSKRHKLGLPNGSAGCHRQDHAFGHAGRQGKNQQRAAEDH